MNCFDLNSWHANCDGVVVFGTDNGCFIFCPLCRIVARVQDIAVRISPADSYKLNPSDRQALVPPTKGVEVMIGRRV